MGLGGRGGEELWVWRGVRGGELRGVKRGREGELRWWGWEGWRIVGVGVGGVENCGVGCRRRWWGGGGIVRMEGNCGGKLRGWGGVGGGGGEGGGL